MTPPLLCQMLRVKAGVREKPEVLTMGFACRALVVRAAWLVIIGAWMEFSGPVDRCVLERPVNVEGQPRRNLLDMIRKRFDTALGRHIVEATMFTCCLLAFPSASHSRNRSRPRSRPVPDVCQAQRSNLPPSPHAHTHTHAPCK